jgi:HK97 family phage major capsid protein
MSNRTSPKAIREFVSSRVQTLQSAMETRKLTKEEENEIDSIGKLLDEADREEGCYSGEARTVEGFNTWSRAKAADSEVGRGNVSYQGGERSTSVSHTGGGTRYVDGRGREVRTFARGESYSDTVCSPADASVSIGKILRGVITGSWVDADNEKRTMLGIDSTSGGFLLNPALSSIIIDRARNMSSVFRAGATFIPMEDRELHIAKVTSDPTAYWTGEGATIQTSEAAFGQIRLYAKKLACLVPISIELFEDTPNGTQVVENAVMQAMALELDRACLRGTDPVGIRNQSGVNVISSVGAPTYDYIGDAMEDIEENNGMANAWILNARDNASFRLYKDGNGMWLRPPEDVAQLTKLVSNQIPSNLGSGANESEIYVGQFSDCYIGIRTQAQLEIFRSGGTATVDAVSQALVWVRCLLRADINLAHANHFTVLTGVTG